MSDPQRLRHDGDEFERELLGSARNDGPSTEGRRRALLAASTLAAGTAVGTAGTASAAAPSTLAATLSWMAVGAALGGGTLAAVEFTRPAPPPALSATAAPPGRPAIAVSSGNPGPARAEPRSSGAAAQAAQPPAPLPSLAPASQPGAAARPEVTARAETPPEATARPEAPAPEATGKPEAARPDVTAILDPLVVETLHLDAARAALAQGKLDEASRHLQRHAVEFPRGKLAGEALVLRVELLHRQGNRDAARAEAARFLEANPRSPHAPRLRAMLGMNLDDSVIKP